MKNYFDRTYISNRLKGEFAYILRLMHLRKNILFFILLLTGLSFADSNWEIVSSTSSQLVLRISTDYENEDDIKPYTLLVGLPSGEIPQLKIIRSNDVVIPGPVREGIPRDIVWVNNQILQGLYTASLQLSPMATENTYSKTIIITISFAKTFESPQPPTAKQKRFLENRIINWDIAQQWTRSGTPKRVSRTKAFPDGEWVRFTVEQDGVYALKGETILSSLPDVANIDMNKIRLYTHSSAGREAMSAFHKRFGTSAFYQEVPENLIECAIEIIDDGDSRLSANDEILFYGRGAGGFDYVNGNIAYSNNVYYSSNTYWLLIPFSAAGDGLRIRPNDETVPGPASFDYGTTYQHIEYDVTNPYQSGLLWVGPTIPKNSIYTLNFDVPDVVTTLKGQLKLAFLGNYNGTVSSAPRHTMELYKQSISNDPVTTFAIPKSGSKILNTAIDLNSQTNSNLLFLLKNVSGVQSSAPYFDYATFSYPQKLKYTNRPLRFYAPQNSGPIQLKIDASPASIIWDISDSFKPVSHDLKTNGTIEYNSRPDTYHQFVIFQPEDAEEILELTRVGSYSFTTLRHQGIGVEHVIIGPESFRQAAEPFRLFRDDKFGSIYASLETIYNEFSGGNADPYAIHSFLQWTQDNWQEPIPEFVLILGDADYDYKNITGKSKTVVPTIEVGTGPNSHCTDDRFAAFRGRIPELAIGRYTAHTTNDVTNFVDKTIALESNPELGIWRQQLTLVADDGARPYETSAYLEKTHTFNSQTVAALAHPAVQVNKLYMIEYPEVNDASTFGVVKPDATAALLSVLEQGTAIINYIGHGSAHQWAQERLLTQDRDLDLINTGMRLPLWIAGTCSWGHFDDVDTEAFAEELSRLAMNGASGVITTTRPISFSSNEYYIKRIFNSVFPNRQVTKNPIGFILQNTKTGNTSGEYFQLFGDPATPLPIPYRSVAINTMSPDTLTTLDTATVSGSYTFSSSSNTGQGIIQLKDTETTVTRNYYYKSTPQTISYTLPGGTLFRGQFTFDSNQFSTRLRVPNDYSYSTDPGKISIYIATNDDPPIEALGYYDNVPIRGGDITQDNSGPLIMFYTEDYTPLYSGDHIAADKPLLIQLTDPIGINVTGHIGHKIIVTDNLSGKEANVTDRFIYNPNSITTGTISYRPQQTSDEIQLTVKAWDSANNPAEALINLAVVEEKDLALYQVYNYPNPFATTTQFTFEITAPAEVGIKIYTLSGRKIAVIEPEYFSVGYHVINWDGLDEFGDNIANGAYLYQVTARIDNKTVSTVNTCAKFR